MKLIKRVEYFLTEPTEAKFKDVCSLLEAFGFEEVRSNKHHVFRNASGQIQIVPKCGGQKVKREYIKQINQLLDLEAWYATQQDKS